MVVDFGHRVRLRHATAGHLGPGHCVRIHAHAATALDILHRVYMHRYRAVHLYCCYSAAARVCGLLMVMITRAFDFEFAFEFEFEHGVNT